MNWAGCGGNGHGRKGIRRSGAVDPQNAAVRLNYGTWLLNQSRWDEAQREFEAVVRIEPGNLQAQQNLASLQARRQHTP